MANNDHDAQNQATVINASKNGAPHVDLDEKGTQLPGRSTLAILKVIDGPGAGASLAVYPGDNAIGRSAQNRVSLAFGDDAIHRDGHAWIHAKAGELVIEHGGKSNAVYVNGEKLDVRRPLKLGDQIKLGSTTLRLDPA
jgi:hypothetical protein